MGKQYIDEPGMNVAGTQLKATRGEVSDQLTTMDVRLNNLFDAVVGLAEQLKPIRRSTPESEKPNGDAMPGAVTEVGGTLMDFNQRIYRAEMLLNSVREELEI